jgi:hypothetical protein
MIYVLDEWAEVGSKHFELSASRKSNRAAWMAGRNVKSELSFLSKAVLQNRALRVDFGLLTDSKRQWNWACVQRPVRPLAAKLAHFEETMLRHTRGSI